MAAAMSDRTVLPPEQPQQLIELIAALDEDTESGAPALVTRSGRHVAMPDELYDVLRNVLGSLAHGMAITVAPTHTTLTTGEAAQLLGVSRPTLVRLLEEGSVPYEQPARHRKIKLGDLLAYRERARRSRAAGLDEMVHEAEEAGLYELPDDAAIERLSTTD
ncbi:hypothetical protein GCM10009676_08850 [Prauserella halophila]|uniref:Helix-turn-helix domain-containing protein n=1 Tax=Prauserella halophila TaxID=185641 RepID=A0ABN1W2T2_9PSEU|nr:excisionase family DNA-binding protein [Prauserella halophila]MCP2235244.1 DNA binding domain-containing protein, excisionase family [Prauserella halophila]